MHITDAGTFEPVCTGLVMLKTFCELYPQEVKVTPFATRLMGVPDLHERIWTEKVEALIRGWQADLNQFATLRNPHLLYP